MVIQSFTLQKLPKLCSYHFSHFWYRLGKACCAPFGLFLYVVAQTKLLPSGNGELFSTINSEDFVDAGRDDLSGMSIQVPSELVRMFAGEENGNMEGSVRAASFLYFNVESFFPSGLPGEEDK